MSNLHNEYVGLITQLDGVIGQVRKLWMDERNSQEKKKHADKLNELLDQRVGMMKARDAAQQLVP